MPHRIFFACFVMRWRVAILGMRDIPHSIDLGQASILLFPGYLLVYLGETECQQFVHF